MQNMTIKNINPIFFGTMILILLSSCHALVEDEFPDFIKTPVLNSTLQADSVIKVQLSYTANLKDSVPYPIENGIVVITSTTGIDTLTYNKEGWYESLHTAKAGTAYTCEVTIPGYEKLSAEIYVPQPTPIENVIFTEVAGKDEYGENISSFRFSIRNDTMNDQYWDVRMIEEGIHRRYNQEAKVKYDYFGSKQQSIYMIAGQDSVLLNEANPLTIFSNKKIAGPTYDVCFYFSERNTGFSSNYTHYIEFRSVTKSYYEFKKQYYIYDTADIEQVGSSAQNYSLYSNVKNGFGIFAGYSVSRFKIEL